MSGYLGMGTLLTIDKQSCRSHPIQIFHDKWLYLLPKHPCNDAKIAVQHDAHGSFSGFDPSTYTQNGVAYRSAVVIPRYSAHCLPSP